MRVTFGVVSFLKVWGVLGCDRHFSVSRQNESVCIVFVCVCVCVCVHTGVHCACTCATCQPFGVGDVYEAIYYS